MEDPLVFKPVKYFLYPDHLHLNNLGFQGFEQCSY
jgi:hypothetical protein